MSTEFLSRAINYWFSNTETQMCERKINADVLSLLTSDKIESVHRKIQKQEWSRTRRTQNFSTLGKISLPNNFVNRAYKAQGTSYLSYLTKGVYRVTEEDKLRIGAPLLDINCSMGAIVKQNTQGN